MDKIFTIFCICLAASSISLSAALSLPCNHPLRISAPSLFSHCTCTYSQWSEWETVSGSEVPVSTSQCPSGRAYSERRSRSSFGSNCNDVTSTRQVCTPDREQRLILALGLGGSGNDYTTVQTTVVPVVPIPVQPFIVPFTRISTTHTIKLNLTSFRGRRQTYGPGTRCPRNGGNGRVCHSLTALGKRKRSTVIEEEPIEEIEVVKREAASYEQEILSESPIMQFNWEEHAPRFRRQTQTCSSNDVQHVLFVLDTSGSIGASSFNRMKQAIAKLTPLFCKKVKFSLMTYSTDFNLEFCFNCFENTFFGRSAASNAIKATRYRGGGTNTGAAARCVCQNLLTASCGYTTNPTCLDVVFITDGQSNDPRLNVCNEIRCLHRQAGVNTYAIGINGYNKRELDCISHSSGRLSAFEYTSFNDFENAINNIVSRLAENLPSNPNSCAALTGQIDPSNGLLGK